MESKKINDAYKQKIEKIFDDIKSGLSRLHFITADENELIKKLFTEVRELETREMIRISKRMM